MRIVKSLVPALLLAILFSNLSYAASPDRIAGAIDSSRAVPLTRSVHPQAVTDFDRGAVSPSFKLQYMTLVTEPSPAQQRALNRLMAAQQDPTSPSYHQWLTPAQYADRFGLSQSDMDRITGWLKSQGFTVLSVGGGRNTVVFSGTAAQVQKAFSAEIHRFNVNGEKHFANATSLMIPAAFNGIVTSIRGVNDFRMHTSSHLQSNFGPGSTTVAKPRLGPKTRADYTDSNFIFPNFLAPADVETIYDTKPLITAASPTDGSGEKIAIVGRTDIFLADINDFRSAFGLTPISASNCTLNTATATTANVITACNDPRFKYILLPGQTDPLVPDSAVQGDITEADLDVEWSGAAAPGAQVVYINAPQTDVTDSLAYAINPPTGTAIPAPIISMSFGTCEPGVNTFMESELQQGAAEGITIINSTGDQGAAACDGSPVEGNTLPFATGAVNGLAVNYPASSPFVTGVGGTSISLANDSYPNPNATYWNASNGTTGGSAVKYIPELTWNDEEAFAAYCAAPISGDTFCAQSTAGWVKITSAKTAQEDIWINGGGGGASNCFTSNSTTCTGGFPQPSWQSTLTVPSAPTTRTRWVPDVSLLASANFPGYILCTPQNPDAQSPVYTSTCVNGISGPNGAVEGFNSLIGGTSASAPIFAGFVALLNQYLGGPASPGLGLINPTLYNLAKARTTNKAFNQTTGGDNDAYCKSGTPSFQTSASGFQCPTAGVMGYNAANQDTLTGYNLVTGLGSVDVNNLAIAWDGSRSATTVSTLITSSSQVNLGQSVTLTATLSSTTALGNVNFFVNGSATPVGTISLTSANAGVAALATTSLPAGTDHVTAAYAGDTLHKPSAVSSAVTVTVTQPDFSIAVAPALANVVAGHNSSETTAITLTFTPINGLNQPITPSCTGMPNGATCAFSPTPVTMDGTHPQTTNMTIATAAGMGATSTNITISATGSGVTHTFTPFALTTTATDQSFTLAPQNANYSVTRPQSVNAILTLTPTKGFNTAVTYTCTDTVSETTCTGPSGATTSTSPSFVITTTAPTRAMAAPFGAGKGIFYAALLPGLLGIMLTMGSRKRSLRGMRMLGLIAVLGVSTLGLGSCSGSNSSTHDPGTPTGPQSVTVNATTGGANPVTATTTINFTVN